MRCNVALAFKHEETDPGIEVTGMMEKYLAAVYCSLKHKSDLKKLIVIVGKFNQDLNCHWRGPQENMLLPLPGALHLHRKGDRRRLGPHLPRHANLLKLAGGSVW